MAGVRRTTAAALAVGIAGVWVAAALLLAGASRGARSQSEAAHSRSQGSEVVPTAPAGRGAPGREGSEGEQSLPGPGRGADPRGSGDWSEEIAFPPPEGTNPRLPFKLSVDPECGRVGDRMTARVRTLPGTHLSLAVVYADGQARRTWYAGPVDPKGELVFPWVVPPDAPPGNGKVMVAALGPDRKQATAATARFRVAGGEGCR